MTYPAGSPASIEIVRSWARAEERRRADRDRDRHVGQAVRSVSGKNPRKRAAKLERAAYSMRTSYGRAAV